METITVGIHRDQVYYGCILQCRRSGWGAVQRKRQLTFPRLLTGRGRYRSGMRATMERSVIF